MGRIITHAQEEAVQRITQLNRLHNKKGHLQFCSSKVSYSTKLSSYMWHSNEIVLLLDSLGFEECDSQLTNRESYQESIQSSEKK